MKRIFISLIIVLQVLGCERNTRINLGDNYYLINSESFNDLIMVTSENIVVVKGNILDYAFDSNMIILSQRPRDSIQGIETLTYKEYKKAYNKSNLKLYWIVDKSIPQGYDNKNHIFNNVYGPFKMDEYLQKRKQLGVPKELILKN